MAIEVNGKVFKLMEPVTGTGKTGTAWNKQEFIIETDEQYPKKVCFSMWGEKTDALRNLTVGDLVKVSFNPESREYNDRWYTDLRAWRIEKLGNGTDPLPQPGNESAGSGSEPEMSDDLPF